MTDRVAVAAPNPLASRAGAEVAQSGGNAVDAAVAAMVVACTTEPGICSLGGGGYATVSGGDEPTATIDGYVAMPGLGRDGPFDDGIELHTGYGGGVDMVVGHGSIATPGTPSMLVRLHELRGRLPWADVLSPAIAIADEGFPIGSATDHYMAYVHDTLYGWHGPSRRALHHPDGRRLRQGERCVVEHLDETLRTWQADPETFTTGEVAARIVADVAAHDGRLGHEDLEAYEPSVRDPLAVDVGDWRIETNPPPAIGGVVLALMLTALESRPSPDGWAPEDRADLVDVMRAVLAHRVDVLDLVEDRWHAGWDAVEAVRAHGLAGLGSPSTVHVSAADDTGRAVAVTCSSGYGSGVMPPGTGVWMNNCLGELELVRRGWDGYAPGERLPSNMAPTVGVARDGRRIAIGSPGADRITSAITQTLVGLAGGMTLRAAVDAPRVHVTRRPDGSERVDVEGGAVLDEAATSGASRRDYPASSMYFGGVAVTMSRPDGSLEAVADPRRDGGTVIT